MRKTEIVLIVLGALGLTMRFLHLPGASLFILLPFLILGLTYMHLGFALFNDIRFVKVFRRDSYNNIKATRIIGAIMAGLALNVSILGIIFRFLSYPGASIILLIGLITTSIVTIVAIIRIRKNSDRYYLNILKRIAIFGTLCFILVVLPYETWMRINHPKNPEYVEAVIKLRENPEDQELRRIVDEEWEKMINENK